MAGSWHRLPRWAATTPSCTRPSAPQVRINLSRSLHPSLTREPLPLRSLLGAIRRLCGTASSILNLLALALLSILVRIISPSNLMVLARSIMFAINGFLIRARGGVACSHTLALPAPTPRSRRPKPNRGLPGGARCTTLSFLQVLARCLASPLRTIFSYPFFIEPCLEALFLCSMLTSSIKDLDGALI